jgi:hypothetical protein
VSENRELRRTCEPTGEEVVGAWRTLHNEEIHNLYTSPNTVKAIKSRKMRLVGHVARMREMRNAYKILVVKPKRKRTTRKIWM